LLLYAWSIISPQKVKKKDANYEPDVSVIVAIRNEEKNIERRINNLIAQEYPKDKLEIIIVSDGSIDKTNAILSELAEKLNGEYKRKDGFIKLVSYTPARGKPYAINLGLTRASGQIIIFADCRQRFSNNSIKQLVSNFRDEGIGCVSGELIFEETPGSSIEKEMGIYWKFEKVIRRLESRTSSVPGATGAIYSIRKELYRALPEQTLLDDVLTPLHICMQGYRVIFDCEAIAYDTVSKDVTLEKKRKIRTLAGNWQLLVLRPSLINPIQNPLWFNFISHKIFRLIIPYSFIILVGIAIYLLNSVSVFALILIAVFFITAILPPLPKYLGVLNKLSRACRIVILLNYFALIAPFNFIGSSKKIW
jgi:cellulose synthase/poly-beta-1,6-N-acetylglucosamine synthase-like glycosyltransferase